MESLLLFPGLIIVYSAIVTLSLGWMRRSVPVFDMILKSEDLPTFGRPTTPIDSVPLALPSRAGFAGSAAFFGGIFIAFLMK